MTGSKIHKLIFRVFNLTGVYSLQFDGQKFQISKFRYFLSSLFIFGYLVVRFYIHLKVIIENKAKIKVTNFSRNFFDVFIMLNFFSTSSWIIILFIHQKNISKIFTSLQDFKIDFEKIEKKILISFVFYNSMLIIYTGSYFLALFFDQVFVSLFEILMFVLFDFICIFYATECSCFFNIILIHYDFLIKNFNQFSEYQVELVHNDCSNLMFELYKIEKVFNDLNTTLGSVLSIVTVNHLSGIIAIVSF